MSIIPKNKDFIHLYTQVLNFKELLNSSCYLSTCKTFEVQAYLNDYREKAQSSIFCHLRGFLFNR